MVMLLMLNAKTDENKEANANNKRVNPISDLLK
jgi:hypothetical protein